MAIQNQSAFRRLLRLLGHQYWLRFGIRDRIIRLFHSPDKINTADFEVEFFGKQYKGNFSTFIDWSTYYFGAYCIEELDLMKDAVQGVKDPIILDIGANIGHHSLFASTIAEKVHSFEPYSIVSKKLFEKIELNKIVNIHVYEVGLGEHDEDLKYTPPDTENTGTGSFIAHSTGKIQQLSLPVREGDKYLQALNLDKIDLIKMDIEGFEPQALRGLKNTLYKYRPIIFFEWSYSDDENTREIKSYFPEGYQIFDFEVDEKVLVFFAKKGYKLISRKKESDGNKLAIPKEKMDLFKKKLIFN